MARLERILCVDDDPDIQALLRLSLEGVGGYTVRLCGCGQEALDGVSDFRPDLILLDVVMPGMDGPATLAALRRLPAARTLPVVFMTASTQPDEMAYYDRLGALSIIAKPFDPMTLAQEIRQSWLRQHGG